MNRLLVEADAGRLADPNKQTVGTFLQHWLEVCAKPNVAGKTYERYEEIVLKHLIPSLGRHKLTKLNPLQIRAAFTDALENGRLHGTGDCQPAR